MKLLVVEDDGSIAMGIEYALQQEGYEVGALEVCKEYNVQAEC